MTATSVEPGACINAGPLLNSATFPAPMMPQRMTCSLLLFMPFMLHSIPIRGYAVLRTLPRARDAKIPKTHNTV